MQYLGKFAILMLLATIHQISRAESEEMTFPNYITVLEGSNETIRCRYNGNENLQGATFKLNDSIVATIFLSDCTKIILEESKYITDCEGNRTFTLTMINVSRHDHGKQMTCRFFLQGKPKNVTYTTSVYVIVPVKRVSITPPTINRVLSVCENETISLHCDTSAARPFANISWVYQSKFSTRDMKTVPGNSNTTIKEENNLFITSSILYIIAKGSFNSSHIFCTSSNYPDIVVNSSSITFNILYPPDQSPTISNVNVTDGGTYRIIDERQGVLTCAVPMSNPYATLSWIALENSSTIEKSHDFVSNTLEFVASRNDKNMLTCIAKHQCNNFTKLISVKIVVLYPPTVKPMKDVSIVEGALLNITCDIMLGIPEAVTINWTRQKYILIKNSTLLKIHNISRDSSSNYTCTVANIMKPTIGIAERGESSSTFYIDVLYPPTVDTIKNQTVTEGSDFNISCPVNQGNPNTTNITWTSIDGRIQRTTKFLSFKNISRMHSAIYICTVFNIMNPTNNMKVEGKDSKSFHLIVEYRATIKQFFINGNNSASNVILNEHDNVTFHCNIDSLPTSTTDIRFQNGSKLKLTNSTNNISYDLGPATCLDSGLYECSARNKHNNIQNHAKKQLILFVNCFPRPHPKVQVKSNITTALNVPLVLSFTAVAYPLPTEVHWQKFNGFNWTIIMSYNDTSIRKSNLTFKLTFQNVKQTDLGQYNLVIVNDFDDFQQNFSIIPADIPVSPTKFRVLAEKVSSSSITVGWCPSFNGGQHQYFVLKISKSDEQIWTNVTVQDNGDKRMNYTFEGLSSGTSYKLNVYAENTIGRSNVSETLLFKTEDVYKETQDGSPLAIVVGVVSGLTGAIVAVVFAICFLRKSIKSVKSDESLKI